MLFPRTQVEVYIRGCCAMASNIRVDGASIRYRSIASEQISDVEPMTSASQKSSMGNLEFSVSAALRALEAAWRDPNTSGMAVDKAPMPWISRILSRS